MNYWTWSQSRLTCGMYTFSMIPITRIISQKNLKYHRFETDSESNYGKTWLTAFAKRVFSTKNKEMDFVFVNVIIGWLMMMFT